MAKQPATLSEMRRFGELARLARARHPDDRYFAGLEESVRLVPLMRNYAWAYERVLSTLDAVSWKVLREKALAHFTDHRPGQLKQGFYHQLNEAFAYAFLRRRGHRGVKVLPEKGKTTPDIRYTAGRRRRFCEVKSINISDAEIRKRGEGMGKTYDSGALYGELPQEFLLKFSSTLDAASTQLSATGDGGLIFLNINFDDFTLDFWQQYRRQIVRSLAAHSAPNVFVKIETIGHKFVRKGGY
jgi:hypothetical protein